MLAISDVIFLSVNLQNKKRWNFPPVAINTALQIALLDVNTICYGNGNVKGLNKKLKGYA